MATRVAVGRSIRITTMQNRYAGDVGDFGKFALLKALASGNFRLGVVWYLNLAEETNFDGRFTEYPELESCDQVLYNKLLTILGNSKRSLSEIEKGQVLPSETIYYREPLRVIEKPCLSEQSRMQARQTREAWFALAFEQLGAADLVFLDPDNGIAGTKVAKHNRRSVKYAFLDEITAWLHRRQSVIVYQHQRRQPLEVQVLEQVKEIGGLGFPGRALSFHRQSVRIYYVLPATAVHRELLRKNSTNFMETKWGIEGHFRLHSDSTA